jgi:hypothetical protein
MQRRTRRIIGAVALIAALAAGAAAFTAGNVIPDQTQSYSSAHITGANASSLAFTYSSDGSKVTGATVTLQGDVSATGPDQPYVIKAGFTDGTPADALGTTCTAGTYASPSTPVTCDFTGVSGGGYTTMNTTQFNMLVTGHA